MSDNGAKKRKQEPSIEDAKDALIAKKEEMINRLDSMERSSEGWLRAKDVEIEFWHNLYSKGQDKIRRLERLITKCPSCSERLQLGEGGSSSSTINAKDAAPN